MDSCEVCHNPIREATDFDDLYILCEDCMIHVIYNFIDYHPIEMDNAIEAIKKYENEKANQ